MFEKLKQVTTFDVDALRGQNFLSLGEYVLHNHPIRLQCKYSGKFVCNGEQFSGRGSICEGWKAGECRKKVGSAWAQVVSQCAADRIGIEVFENSG